MGNRITINDIYGSKITRFLFTEECANFWTSFTNYYENPEILDFAVNQIKENDDQLKIDYYKNVPRAKLFKGILLPGYIISPKNLVNLNSIPIYNDDIIISSYPRSGNHWLSEAVYFITVCGDQKSLSQAHYDRTPFIEIGEIRNQQKYLKKLKSPRVLTSHLIPSLLPCQIWSTKSKIIYLIRNPADQNTSFYYHHQFLTILGSHKHDWNAFFECFMKGYLCFGSWFNHTKEWLSFCQQNKAKIFIVTYEEMIVDLKKSLKYICQFLNLNCDQELLEKACKYCSFESMAKNPAINLIKPKAKGIIKHDEIKFFRKGIIGDWMRHYSKEQMERLIAKYKSEIEPLGLKLALTLEEAQNMVKESKGLINQNYK